MKNKFKYRLIIGLGNPGSRYVSTYHNVGFLLIDHLAKTMTMTMTMTQKDKKKNFEFIKFSSHCHGHSHSIILVKPLTFVNESGKAVAAALGYFKVKLEEILVIHDDSDIKLGKFKLSFGRGSGGHKGVQSIIDELKTSAKGGSAFGGKNFWRLRIGVRKEEKGEEKREKAGEIVLKKITPADKLILRQAFKLIEANLFYTFYNET